MPMTHEPASLTQEQIFEALRDLKVDRSLIDKLQLAEQGDYAPGETVTVSRDCLILVAQVNYRRGQEHERERCAKIAERTGDSYGHDECCCEHTAAAIRRGDV